MGRKAASLFVAIFALEHCVGLAAAFQAELPARLLILSAGAILALTSVASAAPAMQPLKISKECSQYTGDSPSFCTITESNHAAIPAGTKIFYYGRGDRQSASPPLGTCAFHAGSGTLTGFQAVVTVTVDDKQIWHWDGGYLLAAAK